MAIYDYGVDDEDNYDVRAFLLCCAFLVPKGGPSPFFGLPFLHDFLKDLP